MNNTAGTPDTHITDDTGVLPAKAREQLADALWERGVLAMSGNQAGELADAALSLISRWLIGTSLPFDARDRIERTLRASEVDGRQAGMLAHRIMLALTSSVSAGCASTEGAQVAREQTTVHADTAVTDDIVKVAVRAVVAVEDVWGEVDETEIRAALSAALAGYTVVRTPESMIGKLVRWENKGQWFIARVTGGDGGSGRGSLTGEVVDPGNYIGISEFAPKQAFTVGQQLPNLRPDLLTVIGESAAGSQVGDQHA